MFNLINVFTDYLNLQKSIWPILGEKVQKISKIKICKEIAICLLQDHKLIAYLLRLKKVLKYMAIS